MALGTACSRDTPAGDTGGLVPRPVGASPAVSLPRLRSDRPLLEWLAADPGPPRGPDLHRPLHLLVGEPGLDQPPHRRQGHVVEEAAHLDGDLLVETRG